MTDDPRSELQTAGDILCARLDRLTAMIRTKDRDLIHELWSPGGFRLVGSELGEICETRAQVEAKLDAVLTNPKTLVFDLPHRRINLVGNAGWIFASGELRRVDASGQTEARQYLALCIFENVAGAWQWRTFFGSEPT